MLLIHDLKNLLIVTASRVDAMCALDDPNPRTRQHLRDLSQCLDSMFELVDELLPPPDHEAHMQKQLIDVDAVIAERAGMFRSAVARNVALVIERSSGGAEVMARPIDLERVLLNLVLNASEAMPRGGQVTLRANILLPAPTNGDGVEFRGPFVRITVADTGVGIGRLWQQFDPGDVWSEQRGLGLASVKLIVLRLGGRFHVDSEASVGTMAYIDLPLAP